MSKDLVSKLQTDLRELKKHHQDAVLRIYSYYDEDREIPEGVKEYDGKAPHEVLIARGANAIRQGVEVGMSSKSIEIGSTWDISDTEMVLYGVGLEILLQGIHLKVDSEGYTDAMEKAGDEAPSYLDAQTALNRDLPKSLPSSQRRQINCVIELIREQRNNAVHFGFHRGMFADHFPAFYDVFGFLISEYSEEQLDVLEILDDERKRLREGPFASGPEPEVELSF